MEKEMNIVSSYFYYMWNAWGQEECKLVFANADWMHFWSKWCGICDRRGIWGAAECLWAELSDTYRELLVRRACELYDGHKNRPQK